MDTKRETKKALAAKAADANKAVGLKAAGLSENATAAEVVRLFKSTAADVEKSTREGMRKLAKLAALLVEGYGLTQEQVAEKVGRSQPWVSGILRWRRDGYKQVAFGPETRSVQKLLAANNSNDTSTRTAVIRTTAGDKLDPSTLGGKAKAQLDKAMQGSAITEISPEVRKAAYDDTPPAPEPEKVDPDLYIRMQLVAQVTELKRLATKRVKRFEGIAVNPDDLDTVITFLTALKPIVGEKPVAEAA